MTLILKIGCFTFEYVLNVATSDYVFHPLGGEKVQLQNVKFQGFARGGGGVCQLPVGHRIDSTYHNEGDIGIFGIAVLWCFRAVYR